MPRAFSIITQNAYLLLLITMIFWAGNAVAGRFAVGEVSPLALTWLRWTLGCRGSAGSRPASSPHGLGRSLRRHWAVISCFMGASGFAIFKRSTVLGSGAYHGLELDDRPGRHADDHLLR